MDLNDGEINLLHYQKGMSGSFMKHLFGAMFAADLNNLQRLAMGFPQEAEAVRKWGNVSGYSTIIEKAWDEFKR